MRYQCHTNVRHPGECAGHFGYSVPKVDGIIDELLCNKFSKMITAASETEILSDQNEKDIELARSRVELPSLIYSKSKKSSRTIRVKRLKLFEVRASWASIFWTSLYQKPIHSARESAEKLIPLNKYTKQKIIIQSKVFRVAWTPLTSHKMLRFQC